METINKKGPIDELYVAGYKGVKIEVYARSIAAAKQKAIEHFKPKKTEKGLIWIRPPDSTNFDTFH